MSFVLVSYINSQNRGEVSSWQGLVLWYMYTVLDDTPAASFSNTSQPRIARRRFLRGAIAINCQCTLLLHLPILACKLVL